MLGNLNANYLYRVSDRPQAILRSPRQTLKTGSEEMLNMISAERLSVLLRVILTVVAPVLLLAPAFIVWELQPSDSSQIKQAGEYQFLTILLSTMAFSALCSVFAKATQREVVAATVGYCAVLVMFLGTISNVMIITNKV